MTVQSREQLAAAWRIRRWLPGASAGTYQTSWRLQARLGLFPAPAR